MNDHLKRARDIVNDEFYTRYEDVNAELSNYDFSGKRVFCPCDGFNSAFTRWFSSNYVKLGLAGLSIGWRNRDGTGGVANTCDGTAWKTRELETGGFETPESTAVMQNSDVVVTNPPFSGARMFYTWLKPDIEFVVVGMTLQMSMVPIFRKYIVGNRRLWPGFTKPSKFEQPDGSIRTLGNCLWFQNMVERYGKKLELRDYEVDPLRFGHYSKNKADDLSDVIYIKKCTDIPLNYTGRMAVPLTFLWNENCRNYNILDVENHSHGKTLTNGSSYFPRTIIKLNDGK